MGIFSLGCLRSGEKSYCGTKKRMWSDDKSEVLSMAAAEGEGFEETLIRTEIGLK